MAAAPLVTPAGELRSSVLADLPTAGESLVTVVSAISARGSDHSALLNSLAGDRRFPTPTAAFSIATQGVLSSLLRGDASAVQSGPPRDLLLLDAEGVDGAGQGGREELRERTCSMAVALADVLLFSVRLPDVARRESNGLGGVRVGLTELFRMQEDGVIPAVAGKRLFVVVVRDYDGEELPREELINGFLQEVQAMYDGVSKPARCPSRIADLFDFEFFALPSEALAPEAFEDSVQQFRARMVDPFDDDYLFEDGDAYARAGDEGPLEQVVKNVWSGLQKEVGAELPMSKELMSAFACEATMRKAFDRFSRSLREWQQETEEGNIIEDFGEAASALVEETVKLFEAEARAYRGSKSFQRKRTELREKMDVDMHEIFVAQTRKLREASLQVFNDRLRAVESGERDFERKINVALKDAQKYFNGKAEKLRPRKSSWRFDNESKELASHMREGATERIQQARLDRYIRVRDGRGGRGRRGGSGPAPQTQKSISLSFHYLHPAPFGMKDSRYEKLGMDDSVAFAGSREGGEEAKGLSVPILPSGEESWDRDFIYQDK